MGPVRKHGGSRGPLSSGPGKMQSGSPLVVDKYPSTKSHPIHQSLNIHHVSLLDFHKLKGDSVQLIRGSINIDNQMKEAMWLDLLAHHAGSSHLRGSLILPVS